MGDGVNIAAYTFLDPGRIVSVGVAGAAFFAAHTRCGRSGY